MMFYLILIVILCRAHGLWYPETCDEMNAKVHAAANATAGVVALENNRARYVMKRYPDTVINVIECERVLFRYLVNNKIQFVVAGQLNGTDLEINTIVKPFHDTGTYIVTYNDFNELSSVNATVKLLFLNLDLFIAWLCMEPVHGRTGSEQLAWIGTSDGILTPAQDALAQTIFDANGLTFADAVDVHFTQKCSTFNVTTC